MSYFEGERPSRIESTCLAGQPMLANSSTIDLM